MTACGTAIVSQRRQAFEGAGNLGGQHGKGPTIYKTQEAKWPVVQWAWGVSEMID